LITTKNTVNVVASCATVPRLVSSFSKHFSQFSILLPVLLVVSLKSPLASCAPAHSVQNSRAYTHLSGQVNSLKPSDHTHLGLFTSWSLHSPLGCQRPSGCPLIRCYSSI